MISGVPALTSRNFKEADFVEVINFLDRGLEIAIDAKSKTSKLILIIWLTTLCGINTPK